MTINFLIIFKWNKYRLAFNDSVRSVRFQIWPHQLYCLFGHLWDVRFDHLNEMILNLFAVYRCRCRYLILFTSHFLLVNFNLFKLCACFVWFFFSLQPLWAPMIIISINYWIIIVVSLNHRQSDRKIVDFYWNARWRIGDLYSWVFIWYFEIRNVERFKLECIKFRSYTIGFGSLKKKKI